MADLSSSISDARLLLNKIGREEVFELLPLDGGRNNRVAKILFEDAKPLVMKSYFHGPNDTRDRLGAEYTFLEMAWSKGVRSIPQPLASEPARHTGLYTFVTGQQLKPGEVQKIHVDAAIDFVISVNQGKPSTELPVASEACFSIDAHLKTIASRVARLADLDAEAPHVEEAAALIDSRIIPLWQKVSGNIAAAKDEQSLRAPIAQRVASPSDFGFHNALVDADGVVFLDFEYAGVDDPAKLVCDFFCQPEIPVNREFFDHFVDRIAQTIADPAGFESRSKSLLSAYRIKWLCIMLNEFASAGRQRRHFSGGKDDWALRCAEQLAKAKEGLDTLSGEMP